MEERDYAAADSSAAGPANGSLPSPAPIFGFWRRVFAITADCLILGLLGVCLGRFLEDYFVSLGAWGRLAGFLISAAYFSILNSDIGRGQTIGKRLMNIKVVDGDGNLLPLSRSVLRYCILGLPHILNGAQLPGRFQVPPIAYVIAVVVFGGITSEIYLYLFNRPTRRCLHDLAAGSFVLRKEHSGAVGHRPVRGGHLAVAGGLSAGVVLFMAVGWPMLARVVPLPEMIELKTLVDDSRRYRATTVRAGCVTEDGRRSTYLAVLTVTHERKPAYERELSEVAAMIGERYPDLLGRDALFVSVAYGYDIGIASRWNSSSKRYTRDEVNMLPGPGTR